MKKEHYIHLFEHFLNKKGILEEFVDEALTHKIGVYDRIDDFYQNVDKEAYIMRGFLWDRSKKKAIFWHNVDKEWRIYVKDRSIIKDTKIARLVHKNILMELEGCLIV